MISSAEVLLDFIVELRVKIGTLFGANVARDFNRKHHGFNEGQLKYTLLELQRNGYVFFLDDSYLPIEKTTISTAQISDNWFVSLTKLGGKYWERVYQPNWDNYLVIDSFLLKNDEYEHIDIQSGSRIILDKVLFELEATVSDLTISEVICISNWEPTYWKTLDSGYCVSIEGPNYTSEKLAPISWDVGWRVEID